MGKKEAVLLLVLVMCYAVAMVGADEGQGGEKEFLLEEREQVVRTDAGEMKVVKGFRRSITDRPMIIGFITMEPNSLFIPQYLDSHLILFIRRGEAKVGLIYKDELVEKTLKVGDVYRIEAGSAFYLVNTGEGQRLHIICSIDVSESSRWDTFQSFFIGGGTNPKSILSGFDLTALSTAFNVSASELTEIRSRQRSGPIVYLSPEMHPPSVRTQISKRVAFFPEAATQGGEEEEATWSLKKFLNYYVFGNRTNKKGNKGSSKGPHVYNIYDRKPDFENKYGSSIAVDESDYSYLSGVGIYLVNLTAGSMMAPHINPTATEYGVVLRGSGTIQMVYPNGSRAMDAKVNEGDVFVVPRFFPFCQIASRTGPFEFFGFTTSSSKNWPQFLVGPNSLLDTMIGPELAASFGMPEESVRKLVHAQQEDMIFPSAASVSPPEMMKNGGRGRGGGDEEIW